MPRGAGAFPLLKSDFPQTAEDYDAGHVKGPTGELVQPHLRLAQSMGEGFSANVGTRYMGLHPRARPITDPPIRTIVRVAVNSASQPANVSSFITSSGILASQGIQ